MAQDQSEGKIIYPEVEPEPGMACSATPAIPDISTVGVRTKRIVVSTVYLFFGFFHFKTREVGNVINYVSGLTQAGFQDSAWSCRTGVHINCRAGETPERAF